MFEECAKTPFDGIGKPEPLKGNRQGFWSRQIDEEHRFVYTITDSEIIVVSLRGHYDDAS
jgi:toxin YoeB